MKCSAVALNRWKLCNSSDTVLVALFQYALKKKPSEAVVLANEKRTTYVSIYS